MGSFRRHRSSEGLAPAASRRIQPWKGWLFFFGSLALCTTSTRSGVSALAGPEPVLDRRSLWDAAARGAFAAVGTTVLGTLPVAANAAEAPASVEYTVPISKSVVVLGANGGTGRECIASLLKVGRKCIATSRSGTIDYVEENGIPTNNNKPGAPMIEAKPADVTSLETINKLLEADKDSIGAVIFAASASTKGGDASSVDKEGVIHAAEACIQNNIPRLVIVSSGTVTRPDSAVYKLLNFVGKGIMEAKIEGEDAVRAMYANPQIAAKGLGYTVIRPGGLTTGESGGADILELNQGDNKSGRLSRADVAELCVHCLDHASTFDTTFECYEAATAKPVESVGLSNILKSTDPTTFFSGKERRGDSWAAIFQGLERDC